MIAGKPQKVRASGSLSELAIQGNWILRASEYDAAQAVRITKQNQSDRDRAAAATEGAIADQSELYRRYIQEAAGMSSGTGQATVARLIRTGQSHFLLEAHKTLFGSKAEINSTNKEVRVIVFKPIEK